MEKEIVVKFSGIFCNSRNRKKGIVEKFVEKLRRYMHALHDAWVGD